jgi:hypothetical protein
VRADVFVPSPVKVPCRTRTPAAKLRAVSNDSLPGSETDRVAIHRCMALQVALDAARRKNGGTCGRMATLSFPMPVTIAWTRTATHERFTLDCTDHATKRWQVPRLRWWAGGLAQLQIAKAANTENQPLLRYSSMLCLI